MSSQKQLQSFLKVNFPKNISINGSRCHRYNVVLNPETVINNNCVRMQDFIDTFYDNDDSLLMKSNVWFSVRTNVFTEKKVLRIKIIKKKKSKSGIKHIKYEKVYNINDSLWKHFHEKFNIKDKYSYSFRRYYFQNNEPFVSIDLTEFSKEHFYLLGKINRSFISHNHDRKLVRNKITEYIYHKYPDLYKMLETNSIIKGTYISDETNTFKKHPILHEVEKLASDGVMVAFSTEDDEEDEEYGDVHDTLRPHPLDVDENISYDPFEILRKIEEDRKEESHISSF